MKRLRLIFKKMSLNKLLKIGVDENTQLGTESANYVIWLRIFQKDTVQNNINIYNL